MTIELTVEALKAAKFRGPVRFYDGRNGWARQDFESVDEPRFGYFWKREDRKDRGRQSYTVDGVEVASLEEACKLLALPVDPNSPDEMRKRFHEEFSASPKLNYGATRALSEARCNADVGPFAGMRSWRGRIDGPYHSGINRYADAERTAGREWPSWLYTIKTASYETARGMYLFAADRLKDTGLRCALGKACRECPILQNIEAAMEEARTRTGPFSYDLDDADIDAAKVWTCVGHVLTENPGFIDGAMFSTEADRTEERFW